MKGHNFEGGKKSCNILVDHRHRYIQWSGYWTHIYFSRKRLYNVYEKVIAVAEKKKVYIPTYIVSTASQFLFLFFICLLCSFSLFYFNFCTGFLSNACLDILIA